MTTNLRLMPLVLVLCVFTAACASGPRITPLPVEAEPVDAPYQNVLVVALFKSADVRRRYEREVVGQLEARGVKATALTRLVSTSDPLNREAVARQVKKIGADAVLVSQVINVDQSAAEKDQSPEWSYKFYSTTYVNVYEVKQFEYEKLPMMEITYDLAIRTDVYSTSSKKKVWSIASRRHIEQDVEVPWDYSRVANEAEVIVGRMAQGNLID